jgi:type IV secretory pathway TraG/TraD family ATPase VirD4
VLFFILGYFAVGYVLVFVLMMSNRNSGEGQAIKASVEAELQAKIDQCFSDNPPSSQFDVPGKYGKNLDFKSQMKIMHLTREQVIGSHRSEINIWRQEIEASHNSYAGGSVFMVILLYGTALAFWVGILVIFIQHRRGKIWKRGGKGAHGSAQWGRRDEVITAPQHRWVIPLWCANDGTARPWTMKETRGKFAAAGLCTWAPPEGDAVCSHFLLIGATGSGKGAGIFSHVMCSSNVPSIYQDVKAECPNIDHPRWRNAIRWGCAADGGWPSMRWNPLQEAFDDIEPEDACLTVASLLLPDNEGEDAWVSQLARPILAELFLSRKWTTIGGFADEVRGMKLESILEMANIPGGLQSMMEGKNVPQYLSAAFHSNLAAYRMGWGRTVTSAHDFSLDDMIDKGGYVLSAETQDLRRAPLRLFWALLLRRLMRSARPRPLNLLMDEAKAAGKIPDVVNALVTLRNRKVSIWMSFQSEAAITSVYKKDEAEALVDGFGNRITLLHGISARDAKQLSENMRSWSKKRGGHVGISMGQMPSVNMTSGTDDITALPLISEEDIETRGRRPGERWAIIAARETTKSGHPLIVQMVEGEQLTRLPYPDEAQATRRGGTLLEVLMSGSEI